jgi:hypothetical protein
MIASHGSGIGSLPKLQGHVVAQLHASMTSPRMRHEVSAGMTHLPVQYRMDSCRDRASFQAGPISAARQAVEVLMLAYPLWRGRSFGGFAGMRCRHPLY